MKEKTLSKPEQIYFLIKKFYGCFEHVRSCMPLVKCIPGFRSLDPDVCHLLWKFCVDMIDVTLAGEDTNSIPPDGWWRQ